MAAIAPWHDEGSLARKQRRLRKKQLPSVIPLPCSPLIMAMSESRARVREGVAAGQAHISKRRQILITRKANKALVLEEAITKRRKVEKNINFENGEHMAENDLRNWRRRQFFRGF